MSLFCGVACDRSLSNSRSACAKVHQKRVIQPAPGAALAEPDAVQADVRDLAVPYLKILREVGHNDRRHTYCGLRVALPAWRQRVAAMTVDQTSERDMLHRS